MAKKSRKKKAQPSKVLTTVRQVGSNAQEIAQDPTAKIFGALMVALMGTFALIGMWSFLWNWPQDFSLSTAPSYAQLQSPDVGNIFGTLGNSLGMFFVLKGFGVTSLLIAAYVIALGLRLAFGFRRIKPLPLLNHVLVWLLVVSVFISWIVPAHPTVYGGLTGFYLYQWLALRLGHMGVLLLVVGYALLYAIVAFKVQELQLPKRTSKWNAEGPLTDASPLLNKEPELAADSPETATVEVNMAVASAEDVLAQDKSVSGDDDDWEPTLVPLEPVAPVTAAPPVSIPVPDPEPEMEVQVEVVEEQVESDKIINKKVKDFGEYDPTLDLSRFQLPKIDLLKQYGNGQITFDKAEIEANKNNIVDTLRNYNIEIKEIKATIGPTVTLYEIVPAAGIRISKIKNLEDDIALSLAALGIRIIAPIPGKGTIGIEVPNAKPQMVSMRQVVASKKFQESDMELPVAMGRTITNENFVFDLAKMPHLLMAGATGQGKSVGLNAILTSLLYKKHPSQLKFVLVDPKKVELTLYNKIERHYLAVLPDTDEAIITDTAKVVNTLNSLCIEMDNRYELLKSAMVRNIKEYNAKFISRRLNPEEGHKFLPYIVLVIDEFADLIMTAGKEVEMPIARLAQLARAIGIHLIVATQRPSVNVITGIIKANFPARAAFRVTSKIDSRTILDAGGADQLIGKGDMLFSQGSDLTRLQCAFVDTPEVEDICDFIGNQQGYPMAYQLPEYVGEEGGGVGDIDPSDRDVLFEDAARLVVATQQGSTSMIQRKLKLGYNRAGRIVDQLEAAGILGPFEGSKARQVLVPDDIALEQKLKGDV